MATGTLEHVNITVSDIDRTARMLERIFGWHVRWKGPSKDNGITAHVGTDSAYIALYSTGKTDARDQATYHTQGGLNHVGVLVDDLAAAERRVLDAGLVTHSHQTYDPGSRFYFHDYDDVEYEVVSYA
ncbi:VOC family protein [Hyphomonas johnsonii]|uniref:Glyoxalase/bleomycin resistance protein/dioxygenase n=1 Tax=Hyphomonas johnsonii MHS-2 TaxID=1280950 RepID=A0A059FPM7_9PROT|nr:VOC family protein [Hyphomonas johnsonii]KCZ92428.1 glyoxalase/bleomycin resistance protein/dioxygenase [Hyphomonas johnsonii MHS-2]